VPAWTFASYACLLAYSALAAIPILQSNQNLASIFCKDTYRPPPKDMYLWYPREGGENEREEKSCIQCMSTRV